MTEILVRAVFAAGVLALLVMPMLMIVLVGTMRKNIRLAERNAAQAAMIGGMQSKIKPVERDLDAGGMRSTQSGEIAPETAFPCQTGHNYAQAEAYRQQYGRPFDGY